MRIIDVKIYERGTNTKMKNKKKVIIITALVLVIAVISGVRIFATSKDKAKEAEVAKVVRKNISQTITVTGNIEAKDKEEISLSTAQKVARVYAREGQQISEGDLIIQTDVSDLQYQLKKAQLSCDIAAMNLAKLQRTTLKTDKKSLENAVRQAELNLESATASYSDAKRKFDQSQTMYNNGMISKEDYEAAKTTCSDLQNRMGLAQITLDNAKTSLSDFGLNKEDQITEQQKQVDSAKTDMQDLQQKIDESTIKSNINGKIVKLDVKENQYPTEDNSTITIYDLSLYKLVVEISQYDAINIDLGQKAAIKVKGLDREYTGTVSYIEEAAEVTVSGTNKEAKVKIEITLDNPDDKIKVGYEADTDITLKEAPSVLAVNFEAVQQDADGKKYVYAVVNNKVVKKYVKTGLETDFEIEITEGLKEGDQYITTPPVGLKEGDLIKSPAKAGVK